MLKRRLIVLSTAFVALTLPLVAQVNPKTMDPAAKAYLDTPGEPIHWPAETRKQLSLASIEVIFDQQPITRFRVTGGPNIEISRLSPFVLGQPKQGFSLILRDTRLTQAWVGFAAFEKDEFLPAVDTQALMRYAKGLLLDAPHDQRVEIIEAPAEFDSNVLLLRLIPYVMTWEVTDLQTKAAVRRTDYVLELAEGKVFVMSVVSDPATQDAVRLAAEDMLAASIILD